MGDGIHRDGEAVYLALRRMVADLLARKAGGTQAGPGLEALHLNLGLALKGVKASPADFAADLVSALEEQVDEAVRQALAFRPEHAFCHRCASPSCAHSLAPSSRHILAAYTPTGVPEWLPFAQYCLDIRHQDVQRLHAQPPAFVTVIQDGETLAARLLRAWEDPSYQLVGQLLAGYFCLPGRNGEPPTLLALTFQVVASHGPRGGRRLGLNVLGRADDGEDLALMWERLGEIPWRRAAQWAQSALSSVVRPWVGNGSHKPRPLDDFEVEERVAGILGGLARRLEREQRGRGRRTGHAEQRHRSGSRPTRKAVDDIQGARPDSYLVDERSGTLVVLGGRGRTHFFTPEGKLVSSVRYSRDAIERKRQLGHWRPAAAAEVEELRTALAARDEAGGA